MIEYYEDVIEHEDAQLDSGKLIKETTSDGVSYYVTGDPLIDKWERMIAEGQEDEINLDEGKSQDDLKYEAWKDEHVSRRLAQSGIEVPGVETPDMENLLG